MHNAMNDVLEFHVAVDQPIGDPRNPDVSVDQELRVELIREEFEELKLALQDKNLIEAADALGDLCYVICGAAISWGIDLGSVFDAIHASNMSKCAEGVKTINDMKMRAERREDGKVLKGPNYRPPDIAGALALAKAEAEETGFGEDCFWPTPTVLKNLPPKLTEARKNAHGKTIDLTTLGHSRMEAANMQWQLKFADAALGGTDESTLKQIKKELEQEPQPVTRELKLAAAMKSIKDDFVPDLKGYFTSYGAYIFDCTKCSRTHAADMKQGSRNGWASKVILECMCGMRFEIVFVERKCKDPTVQARAIDLGGTAPSGGG